MINLGDKVVDNISGFTGVALARIESLYEATQLRVHPDCLINSKPAEFVWLEESRLSVVTHNAAKGFLTIKGK